jgi:hypothetical protein
LSACKVFKTSRLHRSNAPSYGSFRPERRSKESDRNHYLGRGSGSLPPGSNKPACRLRDYGLTKGQGRIASLGLEGAIVIERLMAGA